MIYTRIFYKNLKLYLLFALVFNFSYSQNEQSSISLDNALEKAKQENKQVFVNYLSTNSEFNKDMKQQMQGVVFISNYIVVNIEVPEEETIEYVNCSNPIKTFKGNNCDPIEFPFWDILDSSGNRIATSFKEDNSNIGYPNTKKGVNDFIEVIRNTSKFSEAKINLIKDSFLKVASN